jgi:glycosyltransferase involved in cell wall biosynthesis
MISVVIPTYKEPEALDLCLKSAINGQRNKNQIIVVVDGYFDLNKDVLEKWAKYIDVLNLEENIGLVRAMNLGVYNAEFDKILMVNDDNVFPEAWDQVLIENYKPGYVLTPNQIEPTPSMFRQFHIKDLGRDPKTFNINYFWEYEFGIAEDKIEETGSTFPFLISKKDYLRVGGLDETYPGAWVVDWDFFLKCELSGMKMMRTYACNFYHFVSLGTTPTPEKVAEKAIREQACHDYFRYKWGEYTQHNPSNNSKLINIY